MNATTVGVDLAKNVFEIALADERGHIAERQRLAALGLIASSSTDPHAASSWTSATQPIITPDVQVVRATTLSFCRPHMRARMSAATRPIPRGTDTALRMRPNGRASAASAAA